MSVPLIAISLALCALSVRESRAEAEEGEGDEERALDWPDVALLIAGLAGALLAITQGPQWGWSSGATLASAGGALIALVWFYRAERRARAPILKFQLFANRGFLGAALANAALAFFYVLAFFLMPLYLSAIHGLYGYRAGLMLLPTTATVALLSPLAGRLSDEHGARPVLLCGFACLALSALLQALFSGAGSLWLVGSAFAVMGVGWACVIGPASAAALSSVPQGMGAVALGSCWTIHNMGGAAGLALGLLCYQLTAESRLLADLAALQIAPGPWVAALVNDPEAALPLLRQHAAALPVALALTLFQQSFLAGYCAAMALLLALCLLVLAALAAILVRRHSAA